MNPACQIISVLERRLTSLCAAKYVADDVFERTDCSDTMHEIDRLKACISLLKGLIKRLKGRGPARDRTQEDC